MTKATVILSPSAAAMTANEAYDLEFNNRAPADIFTTLKYHFDFSGNTASTLQGRTGGTFIATMSGFAAFGKGRPGSSFDKHAIVAVRGTRGVFDWVSDAHGGTAQSSYSGHTVHSGFQKVFKSFDHELSAQLRALYPAGKTPTHMHCVGHSLGGAVAGLVAEWAQARSIQPVLYTFGAPRLGVKAFAKNLTANMDKENIYRCYRTWDPVPYVPVWPFVHHPFVDPDGIHFPSEAISPLASHSMPNGYIPQVMGMKTNDFDILLANSKTPNYSVLQWEKELREWDESRTEFNTLVPISNPRTFIIILKAIGRVLQNAAVLSGIIVGAAVGSVSNALDMIAMILERAASMATWMFNEIQFLLRKMLEAAGIVFDKSVAMTRGFIHWVFNHFLTILYRFVRMAVLRY